MTNTFKTCGILAGRDNANNSSPTQPITETGSPPSANPMRSTAKVVRWIGVVLIILALAGLIFVVYSSQSPVRTWGQQAGNHIQDDGFGMMFTIHAVGGLLSVGAAFGLIAAFFVVGVVLFLLSLVLEISAVASSSPPSNKPASKRG